MICPKCQSENPEDAKFCIECASPMEFHCPNCGAITPATGKFCKECAYDLRKPRETPPIDLERPHSYTPKHLADKILTTRSAIEGERKLVTVLFADVSDFTGLSEKLDPEQVHEIMDKCFKILMDEIHQHEGTINQFTGDGVMALFGAPVAHEDHAQRACHAALAIQRAVKAFGEKISGDYGIDFKMRIGLNSGPVIVGAIGDDLRMDYTAVGDTTNLASRMEGLAQPGTVYISRNTQRLVKGYFDLKALEKVPVKGKEEPQAVFELLGAGGATSRLEASAAKGLTRFVGRKNAMAALMDAYDKVKGGTGMVVGVVGEAGVGKSRLLLEFRRQLPRDEFGYLEGRCIHFGSAIPYLPVLDILKHYLEITEGEGEPAVKKRVREKILGLDEEFQNILPPIFDLLSLKVEDETYLRLDPRVKREKLFEALRNLIVRGSQERPLVLAIEDLHWIDRTTEAFLDYFIGWLATAGVMLILLYRPEYTHPWAGKSYFSRIGLDQLTLKSSAQLVKAILEGGETAPELNELILKRAAGNPLFMEELTHSLLENGAIEIKDQRYVLCREASDLQVPDTVHGIIAARIDRLEESLKRIMQVASVIGREFAFRLLQAISGMREDLKYQLLNLQGLELIYEKSLFPELEYIFKHALVQEVAYNSLLSARRKEIHQRIGRAIEELYAGNLEEFYEMLTYHYGRSDDKEKTLEYLDLANRKAQKLYALEDAMGYFEAAMGLLDVLPDTAEHRLLRISMLVSNVFVFQLLNQFPDYYGLLLKYEPVAVDLDNPGLLGGFYVRKAHCEWQFGLLDESLPNAEKAIDLCEACDNAFDAGYAYMVCLGSHLEKGNFEAVLALKEKVIQAHQKAFFLRTYVLSFCAISEAYNSLGQWDAAIDEGERALKAADAHSDLSASSLSAQYISLAYCHKGDMARAIEFGNLAVRKASSPVDYQWARSVLGWVLCRAGELEKGLDYLVESLQEFRKAGANGYSVGFGVCLGEGYLLNHQYNEAKQELEDILKLAGKTGMKYFAARCHYLLGEVSLEADPAREKAPTADTCFENAISICREIKAENLLALAYGGLGRWYRLKGNAAAARDYLNRALEIFERLGTLLEPDKVREELAQLPEAQIKMT
ncbi:adenylate and Guanylate cyclase catalytic domain protein [delta proteobacterium NaphS2]|nr:adenylate and Guanylate cyclase catalytic domain protein [delta proteobacterium NaphS2]